MKYTACRAFLPLLLATACGGSQQPAAANPTTANRAPAAAPTPRPQPAPAPAADPRQKLVWVAFYDEIQALTIYPQPGAIRSEVAAHPTPGFDGQSRYFSFYSNYGEREADFVEAIHSATSLDDLLAKLRALPKVRVQELTNPVFADPN